MTHMTTTVKCELWKLMPGEPEGLEDIEVKEHNDPSSVDYFKTPMWYKTNC